MPRSFPGSSTCTRSCVDRFAGGFFGEMALLDGGPRVATVTATTPMRLLVMSRAGFVNVLTDVPAVALEILVAVGGRLRTAHAQLHPRPVGS